MRRQTCGEQRKQNEEAEGSRRRVDRHGAMECACSSPGWREPAQAVAGTLALVFHVMQPWRLTLAL